MEAVQFTVNLKEGNILNYEVSNSLDKNIYFNNNSLHFAWTSFDSKIENEIYTLYIKTDKQIMLSEILKIDENNPALSFDTNGNTNPVTLSSRIKLEVNHKTQLGQNQPNPFTSQTVIPFELAAAGEAKISIKNIEGKIILTHKSKYTAGKHSYRFENKQLPPGIYFYSLTYGEEEQIKKMVIIK